jgi:hypothetical protein
VSSLYASFSAFAMEDVEQDEFAGQLADCRSLGVKLG